MKNAFKFALLLTLAVPLFFAGCQKSDSIDPSQTENTPYKDFTPPEYCGDPYTVTLVTYEAGSYGTPYGTATIGNDADGMLHVTMSLDEGYFTKTRFYAGELTEEIGSYFEEIGEGETTGEAYLFLGRDPYQKHDFNEPPYPTTDYFSMDISMLEDCFPVIIHGKIQVMENGFSVTKFVFGVEPYKTDGYYFIYCKEECDEPQYDCETAWAKGDNAICFLDIANLNSNNWGWTQEVASGYSGEWPIWAGAGQCNTDNGTQVGVLHVSYIDGLVTVEYEAFSGFSLGDTHLWVGETMLPLKKNGTYTNALGQFPYSGESYFEVDMGDEYPETIWIAAHSGEACGEY